MTRLGGIVLCGGGSRRMGRSKAWLRCGDEHLLARVVRITAQAVGPLIVAGRADQPLPPLPEGTEFVQDDPRFVGPLAGVAAGFGALDGRCDAALVVSCDHPLIKVEFLRRLADLLGTAPGVAPSHDGRPSPLLAIYRLDLAPLLMEMLQAGERRAVRFARRCDVRGVDAADFADVDPDLDSLLNVNDAQAYEAALAKLGLAGD